MCVQTAPHQIVVHGAARIYVRVCRCMCVCVCVCVYVCVCVHMMSSLEVHVPLAMHAMSFIVLVGHLGIFSRCMCVGHTICSCIETTLVIDEV